MASDPLSDFLVLLNRILTETLHQSVSILKTMAPLQVASLDTSLQRILPVPGRLYGLDALRCLAAVLVVSLHAGIPYMTHQLTHLAWPARDRCPCVGVDCLTWCIECFVMPLFFVMAGFFSCQVLVSRGSRDFVSGRTKRLLWTQFGAVVTVLPPCFFLWAIGFAADGLYVPTGLVLPGLPAELKKELFGVAHLWFLQNLYIYCLILCASRWLAKRVRRSEALPADCKVRFLPCLDRLVCCAWIPLIPAIPCALILYCDSRIVLGFYQTFVPVFSKLAYYAIYFFAGALFFRHRKALHSDARFGLVQLLVAAVLFVSVRPMIHEHLTIALTGSRLMILGGLLALFASFASFGLFTIFLRLQWSDSGIMQYLAASTFWIYLVHLPFVALAQIALAPLAVSAAAKYVFTVLSTMTLTLMTYHVFVHRTALGLFLNGDRRRNSTCVDRAITAEVPFPIVVPSFAVPPLSIPSASLPVKLNVSQ